MNVISAGLWQLCESLKCVLFQICQRHLPMWYSIRPIWVALRQGCHIPHQVSDHTHHQWLHRSHQQPSYRLHQALKYTKLCHQVPSVIYLMQHHSQSRTWRRNLWEVLSRVVDQKLIMISVLVTLYHVISQIGRRSHQNPRSRCMQGKLFLVCQLHIWSIHILIYGLNMRPNMTFSSITIASSVFWLVDFQIYDKFIFKNVLYH